MWAKTLYNFSGTVKYINPLNTIWYHEYMPGLYPNWFSYWNKTRYSFFQKVQWWNSILFYLMAGCQMSNPPFRDLCWQFDAKWCRSSPMSYLCSGQVAIRGNRSGTSDPKWQMFLPAFKHFMHESLLFVGLGLLCISRVHFTKHGAILIPA